MSTAVVTVGLKEAPERICELTTFADSDYVDVTTITTAEARKRSPEQWARAVMEQAPLGRRARMLWRPLGLRLGPSGSSDHVQGWRIAQRGDDWIRVETGSWYMTAQAVCLVDDEHVSLALFLRYDRPIAALVWAAVGIMHRRAVPVMVRQGLRT